MAGFGSDTGICPWCLIPVENHTCPECGKKPRGSDNFNLAEARRFSRKVISGRYRITRYIGHGGMGEVYQAYDSTADEMVAVKFLLEREYETAEELRKHRKRFRKECQTLARLKSPFIVGFVDDEEADDGTPALVMELLRGQTLADLLRREKRLSMEQIVDIAVPVCKALQVAHDKGFVHRDLKPGNIFLHDNGDGKRVVKVVDFGIAKILDDDLGQTSATSVHEILGTCAYMSPEHCHFGLFSQRSDLFSLGTILYQMVSGRLPFDRSNHIAIINAIIHEDRAQFPEGLDVPPALEKLIDQLLQKDPGKRPEDAREVERILLSACGELPSETVRLSTEDMEWLVGDRMSTQRRPDVDGIRVPRPERSYMPPPIAPDTEAGPSPKPAPAPAPKVEPAPKSAPAPSVRETEPGHLRKFQTSVDPELEYKPPRKILKILGVIAGVILGPIIIWNVYQFASATSISSIRNDCSGKAFEELKVAGSVVTSMSIPLTELSAYKLSDGKAFVWVLTDYSKPPDDADLRIKAIVIEEEAWEYVCTHDDPPEDCELIAGAMNVAGSCILLEIER